MDEPIEDQHDVPRCMLCGHDYEFDMPPAIVNAAHEGRLVIFAGAGISTETPNAFPTSLYDEIRVQLSTEPEKDSFPGVMSAYEEEFGRLKLVEECFSRLRYAETFPAVRAFVSRFHRELSSIYNVKEIITTNWDSFFEQDCGAIPIVVDADYAFYGLAERKVYKIHGSIGNVSTMIVTEDDYAESEERLRTSAIGGTLRHLLATKTVVFVGFSFKDPDFTSTYGPLLDGMGKLRPPSYFVSPFESDEADELGIKHIRTDGTHFIRSLKAHLVQDGVLLPDSSVERAIALRSTVSHCHNETAEMDFRSHPLLVFSLAYQDGLLDAIKRIRSQRITGEYNSRDHVLDSIHSYEHLLRAAVERERYWDASYIDGYLNGLMLLVVDDAVAGQLPLYELFNPDDFPATIDAGSHEGEERRPREDADSEEPADEAGEGARPPTLLSEEQLIRALRGVEDDIPGAFAEASRIIDSIAEDQVPQHTPFLYGVLDRDESASLSDAGSGSERT